MSEEKKVHTDPDFLIEELRARIAELERDIKKMEAHVCDALAERDEYEALSAAAVERERVLTTALQSIAANTCCDRCQEAALVARAALESYEPNGGNIYRPHHGMVDPGTFWRCKHGLTTLSKEFLAKGCAACAAEDPVAFRAFHGKTATAAESVGLREAFAELIADTFGPEREPGEAISESCNMMDWPTSVWLEREAYYRAAAADDGEAGNA
jgi:hypothetical protein